VVLSTDNDYLLIYEINRLKFILGGIYALSYPLSADILILIFLKILSS